MSDGTERKALELIGFREMCADHQAEEMRQIARNALGWETPCPECDGHGLTAESYGRERCEVCRGTGGVPVIESVAARPAVPPERPDEGEKGGIVNGEWLSEATLRALYRYLDNGPRLGEVTRALRALAARPPVPEEKR